TLARTLLSRSAGPAILADLGFAHCRLDADYTLTSQTAAQKLFNTTANGALTLTTGVYRFESLLWITGMSGTSGNADFDRLGGGTATFAGQLDHRWGRDTNSLAANTQTGGGAHLANNSGGDTLVAATNTGMQLSVRGMFKCT